jgi:hypothetical protein
VRHIYQRIIDKDIGDCYTACLASILGLAYEEVPQFLKKLTEQGKEYRFYVEVADWLNKLGLNYVQVPAYAMGDWRGVRELCAIATVPSQKFSGGTHAVICKWVEIPDHPNCYECKIIHDPNIDNKPYEYKDILYFTFILNTVTRIRV